MGAGYNLQLTTYIFAVECTTGGTKHHTTQKPEAVMRDVCARRDLKISLVS